MSPNVHEWNTTMTSASNVSPMDREPTRHDASVKAVDTLPIADERWPWCPRQSGPEGGPEEASGHIPARAAGFLTRRPTGPIECKQAIRADSLPAVLTETSSLNNLCGQGGRLTQGLVGTSNRGHQGEKGGRRRGVEGWLCWGVGCLHVHI